MANGIINEPYANFNFLVELDGITRASFHECTGFNSSVEVIEYSEGGSLSSMKLPGRVKYANVVLKRGMTDDMELYNWHLSVVQGQIQRKNGSILLLDRSGTVRLVITENDGHTREMIEDAVDVLLAPAAGTKQKGPAAAKAS